MNKIDKYLKEQEKDKIDILDRIEVEGLIRETCELMEDDELKENAANITWGKTSIEKFGHTIGKSPEKEGFFDACVMKMKGKKNFDEEGSQKFCASLLDKYKGNTSWRGQGSKSWRKGSRK